MIWGPSGISRSFLWISHRSNGHCELKPIAKIKLRLLASFYRLNNLGIIPSFINGRRRTPSSNWTLHAIHVEENEKRLHARAIVSLYWTWGEKSKKKKKKKKKKKQFVRKQLREECIGTRQCSAHWINGSNRRN
jgi:hypothetical protein